EVVMALPTLQQGASGHHVKILQALLTVHAGDLVPKGFIDGDFGTITERVLRTWQGRTGKLAADGICGPATWRWLIGV
ncbi:MAG: peptidoglycan-binding protein, partial [Actinobacteria bacterium]|nr:peptidoglycan-binding protein [Actinomycetota bacterium]